MCEHRADDIWARIWRWIERIFLSVFLAVETYGLIKVGPKATYSHQWHQRIGSEEPCRHTPWGRGLIVAFAAWLALHLGWGRLGLGTLRSLWARVRRVVGLGVRPARGAVNHQQENPRCPQR